MSKKSNRIKIDKDRKFNALKVGNATYFVPEGYKISATGAIINPDLARDECGHRIRVSKKDGKAGLSKYADRSQKHGIKKISGRS